MAATIRDLVERFTAELETLIRAEIRRGFEAALGGSAPTRRAAPPKAPSAAPAAPPGKSKFSRPGRKKGEKRTPEQLAALKTALLTYIRATSGKRVEEIGRDMKLPTKDLKRPLGQLVDTKQVKTTGVKRATRYFPS